MKLRTRLGAMLITVCMLLTMIPAAFAATTGTIVLTINSPTMTVNGASKQIDSEGTTAVLETGGFTMLPLRAVVESMGGSLTWDAATRSITMVKDSQTVKMTVGSTTATVNGTSKTMAKAPYISKAGRTLVHIRALELFTGTTCNWDATNKKVTVTYTNNSAPAVSTKNYRIDVINSTGAEITGLYYAVAGSYQYSTTNALTTNLAKNGTASFYIAVPTDATNKVYDFYTEGTGGMKMYSGLNLYSVNAYATIQLKNTDRPSFQQANDQGITVKSTGDTSLKFVNNSSYTIEELYMATSNSFKNADNLLATETVKSGKSTTIKVDLEGNKSWYFQAVTSNNKEYSGKVTFSAKDPKSATLTLSKSNKFSVGSSSSGDSELTFKNDSGDTIVGIYMAGTKSKVEDADNLLDDDLDDDDTVDIDVDLDSDKTWFITVEFDEYKDLKEQSLTFDYADPASATITIKKSSVSISKEKKSSSSSGGNLTLALVNTGTTDIKEAYLIPSGDTFDPSDDRNDSDDLLDDNDGLSAGEYVVIEEAADSDKYKLILYYGTSKNDYDSNTVTLSSADEYAAIEIEDSDDVTVYDDNDDEVIVGIYNDTGAKMTSVKVYANDSKNTSQLESIGDIGKKEIEYFIFDTTDCSDVEFKWTEDSVEYDDLDSEECFVLLTISTDKNDNATIELDDMDDLA